MTKTMIATIAIVMLLIMLPTKMMINCCKDDDHAMTPRPIEFHDHSDGQQCRGNIGLRLWQMHRET